MKTSFGSFFCLWLRRFYALALTGIHAFFHTESLPNDLLFAYSSKK
jgi:hypothetical protein